ncbi:hypothetical protein BaRGS_00018783 [Batillaria attramentaria]|uniref:Uncharacterized protein n=1 Tax=Batillaria attramentaria TaxID=370345 RepID=A0ABD0KSR3_9CAEN
MGATVSEITTAQHKTGVSLDEQILTIMDPNNTILIGERATDRETQTQAIERERKSSKDRHHTVRPDRQKIPTEQCRITVRTPPLPPSH